MDWKVLLIYLEELNSQTQHRNITKKFYGSHTASCAIWNCVYLLCGIFNQLKVSIRTSRINKKQIEVKTCEVSGKKLSNFYLLQNISMAILCLHRQNSSNLWSQKDQLSLIYSKRKTHADDIMIFPYLNLIFFLITPPPWLRILLVLGKNRAN